MRWGEREYEKQRQKERKKREDSIDEAISPPFPQVQCISFAPETELQGGGMRRKRKEKSEKEDAGGKKIREIYFNETVFELASAEGNIAQPTVLNMFVWGHFILQPHSLQVRKCREESA